MVLDIVMACRAKAVGWRPAAAALGQAAVRPPQTEQG